MSQVKWGVIGAGQVAFDRAIPAISTSENAELVAVTDIQEERLRLVRETYPSVTCYRDYKELLASDVDAVYIGLPNELHHSITIDAARFGKHVLCEKPLAIDAAEAREMIEACEANQVKLMAAYMSRFGDVFKEAKRIIQSGRLGTIALVNANFSFAAWRGYAIGKRGSWRWTGKRGGPLLDAGIYLTFGIRELLNSRFARVSAGTWSVVAKDMPAPDTIVSWFELSDGTPGVLTTAYSHGYSSVVVQGTDGFLVIEDSFAQKPSGRLRCQAGGYGLEFEADVSKIEHFENYRREIQHFSDAILHEYPYRPNPKEILEDMVFLDAVVESAETGKAITINYDSAESYESPSEMVEKTS